MNKAIFFDLDGTLMNTLFDIARAINKALERGGFQMQYTQDEVKAFIGRGAENLVHKALGDKDNDENFALLKGLYMPLYKEYQLDHIAPFGGMVDVIKELKGRGYLLFVISNKPDQLAKIAVNRYFEGLFVEVIGAVDAYPRKPDPYWINRILDKYSLSPSDCLYVGDSLPDRELANNAHMPYAVCTYGYGVYEGPLMDGASFIIHRPSDILDSLRL